LLQAAKDTPRVLNTPEPRAFMVGFGDSSVDFEIRFWIDDPEEGMGNVRSDVLKRMWKLFLEHDIEIPFPQRDLHIRTSKQFDQLIEALHAREDSRSKS
jgi:small-conductance mechanosensitive channel